MGGGPRIIHAGQALDDRGTLTFCNEFRLADIKRCYFVENHRIGFVRAWHGHRAHDTFLWPVAGAWRCCCARIVGGLPHPGQALVMADVESHCLDPRHILHVPAGWYHGTQNLAGGAVLAVFSTATIDEIREDDHRVAWDWRSDVWEQQPR